MKVLFIIRNDNDDFKPATTTQAVTEVKNMDEVQEIMNAFDKQNLKVTGTYPEDKKTWKEWVDQLKLKNKTTTNIMANTSQEQRSDFSN